MLSSTRLYASPKALENPVKKTQIDRIVLVLKSVLEARDRVIIELNVTSGCLDSIVESLPAMRKPTVSRLHDSQDFAVRAAVPRKEIAELIPSLKERGGRDIVVSKLPRLYLKGSRQCFETLPLKSFKQKLPISLLSAPHLSELTAK